MKHLKRFNEKLSNEYYSEIDAFEFSDSLCDIHYAGYKKAISIDKNILRNLKINTKDWKIKIDREKMWGSEFIKIDRIESYSPKITNLQSKIGIWGIDNINIFELPDEWYYVEMNGCWEKGHPYDKVFFKCDQQEGLEKLLQDLEITI